ncbi:helix-turn-helix domain-containing protein [Roseitranquillus sediminis]|uniref:helix-turn-helix domain-containing protein n=1 Tax=Roseitranquillus sediminis TaxID=2809051 RepID=UPI001D0C6FF3|nr:helix-turn-helix domain-containing protein [Roseitranquillus sediminis]MBM9593422.1 helix-turn-helix domain-containing protein [Roseitranquillus sediminis]
MSHRGTNWAIQQRGLKPAVKMVLWHLCDRHNPDHGCFPSQEQLAYDSEIPRRTLNVYLDELERAGLIRRERRINPATRRRLSTRYVLAFEDDFGREPCAASAHGEDPEPCVEIAGFHVQNLHTNPVREPVTTTPAAPTVPLDEVEARCLDVAGPGLSDAGRDAIVETSGALAGWIEEGLDLEADILPTIQARTSRERKTPIRTWDYFTEAIRVAHRRRLARAGPAQSAKKSAAKAAAEPPDPAERLAGWINSGMFVPPSAVSSTMRDELLHRGLVTEAALRRLQIY